MLYQDVKYAVRSLILSPGLAVVAILSLAVGIGVNTTIFTFVNALLLRPLPGRDPSRLVSIYTSDYSGPLYGASSYPDFLDFRARADTFDDLLAFSVQPMIVTSDQASEPVTGTYATGSYFDVLGVAPALGRFFAESDDAPGAEPIAVLSHEVWTGRLGGRADIVGDTIRVNGTHVRIVGVAPRGFRGTLRGIASDVWTPLQASEVLRTQSDMLTDRRQRGLFVLGRLRDGVTSEQAQANLSAIARALHEEYPESWTNVRDEPRVVSVLPERASRLNPRVRGAVVGFLGLMTAVVGLVLMLACANTANLLLARAQGRRKEMATRRAMGAGRGRLVRQLLTEAILLSVLGGTLGVAIAWWSMRLIVAFQPPLPITIDLGLKLDGTVLLFTLGLSLLTGVLFGLAPAAQSSRTSIASALRGDESTPRGGRRERLRGGLVVVQVAISTLLLTGTGLILRSLLNADAIDVGFEPRGVLLASVDLDLAGYTPAEGQVFFRTLASRLEAQSGVASQSVAVNLPLGAGYGRRFVGVEDYEPAQGEDMEVNFDVVGPGFFEVMGIPLVRGRAFTENDNDRAPPVVIVNEAFVRRYWPGREALGKHLTRGDDELRVIGVAKDGKYVTLGEDPRPYVYYPHSQDYQASATILLRTSRPNDALAFGATLRSEIAALDPDLPVYGLQTMTDHLGIALLPVRLSSSLLGALGLIALTLSTGGLYGVVSYLVGRRAHEIGVRVSLGAAPRDITRLVVRQGMGWTLAGTLIGLTAAFVLTRFLAFLLYGVSPSDPATFAAIAAVMALATLAACHGPARKATRVDPVRALRSL